MHAATILGMSAGAWTAVATAALAAVTAVAVGVAIWVSNGQLAEARQLRREQAEPHVVVYAEDSGAPFANIDLVVRNLGKTSAFDVVVKIEPPPESAARPPQAPLALPPSFRTLVPNQQWRTFWDSSRVRARAKSQGQEYATDHIVTVSFKDSAARTYTWEGTVSWDAVAIGDVGQSNTLHELVEALERIESTLSSFKSNNIFGGGLTVTVHDGDAKGGSPWGWGRRAQAAAEDADDDGEAGQDGSDQG